MIITNIMGGPIISALPYSVGLTHSMIGLMVVPIISPIPTTLSAA